MLTQLAQSKEFFISAFYRCRSKWGRHSWTCCPTRRWSRSTRSTPHSWGRRWTQTRHTRPWGVDPQIWGTCRTRSPAFIQTLPSGLIVTPTPKSLRQLQVIQDVKNKLCFGFPCIYISYPLFQFLCLLCSPSLWIKGSYCLELVSWSEYLLVCCLSVAKAISGEPLLNRHDTR